MHGTDSWDGQGVLGRHRQASLWELVASHLGLWHWVWDSQCARLGTPTQGHSCLWDTRLSGAKGPASTSSSAESPRQQTSLLTSPCYLAWVRSPLQACSPAGPVSPGEREASCEEGSGASQGGGGPRRQGTEVQRRAVRREAQQGSSSPHSAAEGLQARGRGFPVLSVLSPPHGHHIPRLSCPLPMTQALAALLPTPKAGSSAP